MKNNRPAISVLMPVYNGERFLKEAIESILLQTFTDFEFIIINDGSFDNTENIIQSYKDQRIVYIKNETNLKLIKALNRGVMIARGKYLARMDADDISAPNRLKLQFDYMEKHPDIAAISAGTINISDKGCIKGGSTYFSCTSSLSLLYTSLFRTPLSHPASFIKTEILKNIYYSDNEESLHIEDLVLWNSLMRHGYKLANLKDKLLYKRLNSDSITSKYKYQQKVNKARFLTNYIGDILPSLPNIYLIKDLILSEKIETCYSVRTVIKWVCLIKKTFLSQYSAIITPLDILEISNMTKKILRDYILKCGKLGNLRVKFFAFIQLIGINLSNKY